MRPPLTTLAHHPALVALVGVLLLVLHELCFRYDAVGLARHIRLLHRPEAGTAPVVAVCEVGVIHGVPPDPLGTSAVAVVYRGFKFQRRLPTNQAAIGVFSHEAQCPLEFIYFLSIFVVEFPLE